MPFVTTRREYYGRYQWFAPGDFAPRQNPRMRVPRPTDFVPKELRQIEHFIRRELGRDYAYSAMCTVVHRVDGCGCADCSSISQFIRIEAVLQDSTLYKKFKDMADKYDLHIRIERDTGRVWASKKGIKSGQVPSLQEGR